MTPPLRRDRRRPFESLLGFYHGSGCKPRLAASVLAECDLLGRAPDCCEHAVELLLPFAVAINELGKVAGGKVAWPWVIASSVSAGLASSLSPSARAFA